MQRRQRLTDHQRAEFNKRHDKRYGNHHRRGWMSGDGIADLAVVSAIVVLVGTPILLLVLVYYGLLHDWSWMVQ